MIGIVDYGMGNLLSVKKALEHIGMDAKITSKAAEISACEGIILPGVGAFPDAVKNLSDRGLDIAIKKASEENKPLLGICLGMQLMFEYSEEINKTDGLGFIKGSIEKLEIRSKVPHMGWNTLGMKRDCQILKGIENESYVYFVHSYYANLPDEEDLKASAVYDIEIPAVVSRGNIFGVQFHPEKSGAAGLKILKNFGELIV